MLGTPRLVALTACADVLPLACMCPPPVSSFPVLVGPSLNLCPQLAFPSSHRRYTRLSRFWLASGGRSPTENEGTQPDLRDEATASSALRLSVLELIQYR